MSEKTETIIRVLPGLENRLVELSQKMEALALQHSPDVWSATKGAVMLGGATRIMDGFVFILLATALAYGAWRLLNWAGKKENRDHGDPHFGGIMGGIVGGATALILAVTGVFCITSLTAWVAVFYPEIVLAKRVLGL